MKLKIKDYNQGQIPSTILEAIKLSGYSRKEIENFLQDNEILKIRNNGYVYGISKK